MKRRLFHQISALALLGGSALLGACSNKPENDSKTPAAADGATPQARGEKRLIIGIDDTFEPMTFRRVDGAFVGFDIDLATEVMKRSGLSYQFRVIDWANKDELLLKAKTIDLIWSAVAITDERKKMYAFSTPYLNTDDVIVVTADSSIQSKADIADKRIGIQEGYHMLKQLRSDFPSAKISEFSAVTRAMVAMLTGDLDAVACDSEQARYYSSRSQGKFRVLSDSLASGQLGVAMRPGDTDLQTKVNQALAATEKDGTMQTIYNRWFGSNN